MTQPTPQDFNRHRFPAIRTGPGRTTGYYMLLREVDHAYKTSKSLIGDYIKPHVEIDLPIGAIVVQRRPSGTAKFASWRWSYAFVPTQDDQWQWSPECDNDRFVTFRDNLTAALQFAPRQQANGYLPDPTLAAPPNFPRSPGPETAIAMARHAYAVHREQPLAPDQVACLIDTAPPAWLVSLAAHSTPSPPHTALVAALALVCNPDTPQPTIIHSDDETTALWSHGHTTLAIAADANGSWRARRIDTADHDPTGLVQLINDAMKPSWTPPGTSSLTPTELRDALATERATS